MKRGSSNKKGYIIISGVLVVLTALFFMYKQLPDKGIDIPDEEIPLGTDENGELQLNIKDFGAIGDGVTDDTESIQRAIDYAYNNSIKHVFIPDGHYMVNLSKPISSRYTAISLYSNVYIYMEDNAIVEAFPSDQKSYAIFNLVDCENVLIEGGTIIGERDKHIGEIGTHGMGINVFKSKDITIKRVNIKDCWGDGIYIGGLDNTQINKNVLVDQVNISNCRRQGISITTGDGIVIKDSKIHDIRGANPQSGIDVETNWPDTPVKNVIIINNTFYNNGLKDIVLGGNCENVIISENNFIENTLNSYQSGINLFNGNNITVRDNTIIGRSVGIICRNNLNVEIANNVISGYIESEKFQGTGIVLKNRAQVINIINNSLSNLSTGINISGDDMNIGNVTIKSNKIENIQIDGVFGYRPISNLSFSDNIISNVIERYGMLLKFCYATEVSNNEIINCGKEYILLENGDSVNVSKNTFIDYNRTKAPNFIAVGAGVKDCFITDNTFFTNNYEKRIVEASWETKYPVTIENNRYTGVTQPFYTLGMHKVNNNIEIEIDIAIAKMDPE